MWNKHSKLVVVWAGLDIFHFSSSILCFLFVCECLWSDGTLCFMTDNMSRQLSGEASDLWQSPMMTASLDALQSTSLMLTVCADFDETSVTGETVLIASVRFTAVAVALGCLLFINAIWSVIAFITSRRPAASTRPLSIFNASLVTMILITLLVGTFIWFQSLRQVQEYAQVFRALDPLAQGYIQDRLECCGYFNATIDGIFTSSTGFCTPDAIPSVSQ